MRIILFTNKQTGEVECFSSLKPFFKKYPSFVEVSDKIDYIMSRKKEPYETESIKLQRVEVQRSLK
jgi:hypothetical protein